VRGPSLSGHVPCPERSLVKGGNRASPQDFRPFCARLLHLRPEARSSNGTVASVLLPFPACSEEPDEKPPVLLLVAWGAPRSASQS
jgi:hypothetical protein